MLSAGKVPVSSLPDLMRAAGFYPSLADINSLLAHVKFLSDTAPADDAGIVGSDGAVIVSTTDSAGSRQGSASGTKQQAAETGSQAAGVSAAAGQDSVDFETFLCLYVNHRPVAEVSQQQIEQAFQALGADTAAGQSEGAENGPTGHACITCHDRWLDMSPNLLVTTVFLLQALML